MCLGDTQLLLVYVRFVRRRMESASYAAPQDVDWHATNEHMFASVGDDKMLMMYV